MNNPQALMAKEEVLLHPTLVVVAVDTHFRDTFWFNQT